MIGTWVGYHTFSLFFVYIWHFSLKKLYQKEIDKISQLPRLGKELNSVYYSLVSLPSILNNILEWVIIKRTVLIIEMRGDYWSQNELSKNKLFQAYLHFLLSRISRHIRTIKMILAKYPRKDKVFWLGDDNGRVVVG